ncbi:ECA oligosaccharide polymerase [Glaesserella sp.]|uniref:ECA oligosaccharide polymerase n=1 Tax=Glaesserella sp. TaxID=2094731 RepID=UPI0035A1A334
MTYFLLSGFYLFSLFLLWRFMFRDYTRQGFSFHLLFSFIYGVIFFGGFPLSMIMVFGFEHQLQATHILFTVFASVLIAYLIYYGFYAYFPLPIGKQTTSQLPSQFAKFDAKLTACLLLFITIVTMGLFVYLNQGFLLFKLEKYHQVFSSSVEGVPLKRFFYFFIPGLLILYFLNQSRKTWWAFLIVGLSLGMLSYLAVGGTRGNMAFAFALFLLIGLDQGYLTIKRLLFAGIAAVVVMFFLALARYKLTVSGTEAILTFLYLSRDTFSPWENFAQILASPIEYQGLMPIVRDFYVFIPSSIWAERPDITWNTANYFTKEVLNNYSGLAMSPTLLGSFYIMGGFPMMAIGMAAIGVMLKLFDALFAFAKASADIGRSAIINAYCWGNIFNLVVLVREGSDGFFSRFVFFSMVFLACCILARMIRHFYQQKGTI